MNGPWSTERVSKVVAQVIDEAERARRHHKAMDSTHYGYAVTLEELDEVWDAIKSNDLMGAKKEMLQVAACAIRFVLEL